MKNHPVTPPINFISTYEWIINNCISILLIWIASLIEILVQVVVEESTACGRLHLPKIFAVMSSDLHSFTVWICHSLGVTRGSRPISDVSVGSPFYLFYLWWHKQYFPAQLQNFSPILKENSMRNLKDTGGWSPWVQTATFKGQTQSHIIIIPFLAHRTYSLSHFCLVFFFLN